MKTMNHIRPTMFLAVLGLAWLPLQASAQQGAGAARLIQLKPVKMAADTPSVRSEYTRVMSCPKCKDSLVTVVEKPTKQGATPETKTFLHHACPECRSQLITQGTGKNATTRLVHVCSNSGSGDGSCCLTKNTADKSMSGMEAK